MCFTNNPHGGLSLSSFFNCFQIFGDEGQIGRKGENEGERKKIFKNRI